MTKKMTDAKATAILTRLADKDFAEKYCQDFQGWLAQRHKTTEDDMKAWVGLRQGTSFIQQYDPKGNTPIAGMVHMSAELTAGTPVPPHIAETVERYFAK